MNYEEKMCKKKKLKVKEEKVKIKELKVCLFHWKWLTGKCFQHFWVFVFAKNKWSTGNNFLVNWKSYHFSVKYLTDLKNVKHFTSFFFSLFFSRKMFSRKSFFEKHFPESDFPWNKRSLSVKKWKRSFLSKNK